jgi:ABC-type Na+ efflux pump permease subunit
VVFGTGLDIAVGTLLVLALANYAGIKQKKPFTWIAAGAMLFVASQVTAAGTAMNVAGANLSAISPLAPVLGILGFIAVLVGGVWSAYKLLTE